MACLLIRIIVSEFRREARGKRVRRSAGAGRVDIGLPNVRGARAYRRFPGWVASVLSGQPCRAHVARVCRDTCPSGPVRRAHPGGGVAARRLPAHF
jgi:hypothetical protein